jgi:cytochrome oxidase Cu insertion factor (SCO1/SenC/PrrC family)
MRRGAWPLLGIALLFLGPLVVAVLLYIGRGAIGGFEPLPNPDRELIANPPAMPLIALTAPDGSSTDPAWARSRWSLIYAKMSACDAPCGEALGRLNQVYLALGAERHRAQRVFLVASAGARNAAAAPFLVGLLDAPGGEALIRLLGRGRLEQGRYFVVDPLGNLILSYPADADQSRLLEDLTRLLEVSRVG